MIFRLDRRLIFPPAELAEENGLLAVGGDLRPERLILAYRSGIFPWYNEDQPILWHSPDPRTVLLPAELHVGRSLQKKILQQYLLTSLREPLCINGCLVMATHWLLQTGILLFRTFIMQPASIMPA